MNGRRPIERAVVLADRIVHRLISERRRWGAAGEMLKHLRLVVLAEVARAERERGIG